jgi:hypothetical protein
MPKLFGELREILFAGHFIMTPHMRQVSVTAGSIFALAGADARPGRCAQVDPRYQNV